MLFCVVAAGCASSSANDRAVSDRLRAMHTDQTQVERRVEELENRLMLLEDHLDTQRVADEAQGRTPTLPVVHIAPSPPEVAPPLAEAAVDANARAFAETAGDATDEPAETTTDDRSPRPVLRLHGSGRQASSAAGERLVVEERLAVTPLPPKAAPTPARIPAKDPLRAYRATHDLVLARRFADAQHGFEEFLRDYPNHEYADNAAYWIAECHYARRDWTTALAAFRRVVDTYPRGNKAPDALLKLGFTYLEAGDRTSAVQVLEQVKRTYAQAQVATLAHAKLEEMQ